ncbi:uncharacterized protein PG986_012389, partial [Apiospora aurea]
GTLVEAAALAHEATSHALGSATYDVGTLRDSMDLHRNPRTLAGSNTRDTHAEFRHARHSNGIHPFQAAGMISMGQESLAASPRDTLLSYLPAFIKSSSSNDEPDFHFSLWEPTVGNSISGLTQPLTPPERRIVEYQKGHLVRHISQFRAPNSRFGPAAAVLRGAPSRSDENLDDNAGLPMPPPSVGSNGFPTWSFAFRSLVEDIIRDGEDLTVMLNYSRIREQMARFSYTLDDVMEPRLVLLDAGSDRNVLVTRPTQAARLEEGSTRATGTKNGTPQAKPPRNEEWSMPLKQNELVSRASWTGVTASLVTPLMAKVFSRNPSDDFLRGFRGQPPNPSSSSSAEIARDIPASTASLPPTSMNTPEFLTPLKAANMPPTTRFRMRPLSSSPPRSTTMPGRATADGLPGHGIPLGGSDERMKDCNNDNNNKADEEDGSAAIRILLYECYHAIVCVIKTFYRTRPPAESKQREMAARRHLTEVLHKLSQVQSEPVGNGHDNSNSSRRSGGSDGSGSSGGDGKGPKSRRASGDGDDEAGGWPIKRRRSEVG